MNKTKRVLEKAVKPVQGKARRKGSSNAGKEHFKTVLDTVQEIEEVPVPVVEEDVPLVMSEDYDDVLADKRHTASIEDDVVMMLRNAMMDAIVTSRVGTPCMKNVFRPLVTLNPSAEVVGDVPSQATNSHTSVSVAPVNDTASAEGGVKLASGSSGMVKNERMSGQSVVGRSTQPVSRTAVKMQPRPSLKSSKKELPTAKRQKDKSSSPSPNVTSNAAMTTEPDTSEKNSTEANLHVGSNQVSQMEDLSLGLPDWRVSLHDEDVEMEFTNGNKYRGRVSRGMMEGRGVYTWVDGRQYEGEFVGGMITGRGKLQWPDKSWYNGEVVQGWRHGKGIYVIAGAIEHYYGEWRWGRKHGSGIYYFNERSDDWYDGEWIDNSYNGNGVRQYKSGARYQGQWRNGQQHGEGTMIWANKDVYRGLWRNGKCHGYGEYMWSAVLNHSLSIAEGNIHRGVFHDGLRHGLGELTLPNGSRINTTWENDVKEGPGHVYLSNGASVYGNPLFANDRPVLYIPPPEEEEEDLSPSRSTMLDLPTFDEATSSTMVVSLIDDQPETLSPPALMQIATSTESVLDVKPVASEMKSDTAVTKPGASEMKSGSSMTKPGAAEMKSRSSVTKLGAVEMKSRSSVSKPGAVEMKSRSSVSKPGAAEMKSHSSVTKPGAVEMKSRSSVSKPGAAEMKSRSSVSKPGVAKITSGIAMTKLGAGEMKSGASVTKSGTSTANTTQPERPKVKTYREPKVEWTKTEFVAVEDFEKKARRIPVHLPDQDIDLSYHLDRLWRLQAERAFMATCGDTDDYGNDDSQCSSNKLTKKFSMASTDHKKGQSANGETMNPLAVQTSASVARFGALPKKQSVMSMKSVKSKSHSNLPSGQFNTKADMQGISMNKKSLKPMLQGEAAMGAATTSRFVHLSELEKETMWMRRAITRHLPLLRRVYGCYANVGGNGSGHSFLVRLMLWQFYRDCGFHRRGISLMQLDDMLESNPHVNIQKSHYPFEPILFSTFLHSLMDVAWTLYLVDDTHESCSVNATLSSCGFLGGAFEIVVVEDILPIVADQPPTSILMKYRNLLPLAAIYQLYTSLGDTMRARDFLTWVYKNHPPPNPLPVTVYPDHMMQGENMFALGMGLSYLPTETPLACRESTYQYDVDDPHKTCLSTLRNVGHAKIVKILDQVCPGVMCDELIVNMDYKMTFLEFFEALLLCAHESVAKEKRRLARAEALRLERQEQQRQQLANPVRAGGSHTRLNKGIKKADRDVLKSPSTLGSIKNVKTSSKTPSKPPVSTSNNPKLA